MNRLIFSSVILASLCAAGAVAQPGAASITNEPHHKRLLYTNDVRFWDVTLPPGQATQPFVHDYDVATVVIGDGTLNIQRNGEGLTQPAPNARSVIVAEHTGAPATYRSENKGTTENRAPETQNIHEGNRPAPAPCTAPRSAVLKESRAFPIYDALREADAPP